jgi:hypothetical protein
VPIHGACFKVLIRGEWDEDEALKGRGKRMEGGRGRRGYGPDELCQEPIRVWHKSSGSRLIIPRCVTMPFHRSTHDHDKLSNVLPPYTTVMALVAPSPWWRGSQSEGQGGGASAARPHIRRKWAWATSDPYLGSVEAWGTADIDELASLLNLARERRVGGILMSAHR